MESMEWNGMESSRVIESSERMEIEVDGWSRIESSGGGVLMIEWNESSESMSGVDWNGVDG